MKFALSQLTTTLRPANSAPMCVTEAAVIIAETLKTEAWRQKPKFELQQRKSLTNLGDLRAHSSRVMMPLGRYISQLPLRQQTSSSGSSDLQRSLQISLFLELGFPALNGAKLPAVLLSRASFKTRSCHDVKHERNLLTLVLGAPLEQGCPDV